MISRKQKHAIVYIGIPILLLCVVSCKQSKPEKMNVVFILSDALRAASLEFHGYPKQTAPGLAKLAKDSVFFKNHYANAPFTRLSVSQMFTSMVFPPMLMGHEFASPPKKEISKDLFMLPRVFRNNGYETTIVSAHPWFSTSARVLEYFDDAHIVTSKRGSRKKYAFFEDLAPHVFRTIEKGKDSKKPFFLYLHTMDTHEPFNMHKEFMSPAKDPSWPSIYKKYDSEILYTDHWTKKIVEKLSKNDLLDKTIIVFTSDHGEEFGEMGPGKDNTGHGANLRRAALHVPLIIYAPAIPSFKGSFEDFTDHLDLSPTLARLAIKNLDISPYKTQGRDLSAKLLNGNMKSNKETSIYSHNNKLWSLRQVSNPKIECVVKVKESKTTVYSNSIDQNNYPRPIIKENHDFKDLCDQKIAKARAKALKSYKALENLKPVEKSETIKDLNSNQELKEQLKALGYVE